MEKREMESIQLDLSLRLKQSHVPKSIGRFLNDLRKLDSVTDKLSMLEIYLQMLKKEYSRVEPFRTDLPLCVQLLVDSIELLNGEIVKLGESTPTNALMNSLTFEANYYAQKQKQVAAHDQPNKHLKFQPENGIEDGSSITPNAKLPRIEPVNDDSLSHQPPKISEPIWKNNRRSWSPELHAIFVEALNSLGGPEVAKPKQIKEVMKIDGLTNDQIKSHLQKYRLQMKAFPAMNSNVGDGGFETTRGQEMFCRDLWMPSTSSPYLSPSQLQERENAEVSAISGSQMQIGDQFRSGYGFEHCLSQGDGSQSAHMYRKYI